MMKMKRVLFVLEKFYPYNSANLNCLNPIFEEMKNQNIEIEEKETIEQIFENWIIGKPYISDNLIEVPVRIFCKPGKIDVIMYMNTQEPSALYQINFTKWNKNDE